MAFAIQQITEEIVIKLAKTAKALTQSDNLVMAGGVAAIIWGRFTEVQPASWRVSPEPTGLARWLKPLLAASVVLYALAVLYSDDRSTGLQNLCFFLIPFATVFALMDEVETEVLSYLAFPKAHRTQIHSTNPLERLNAEVKRRTDVVGIFPNDAAVTRLVGAILLEQNDEWALQRRYMQLEGLQSLIDNPAARLSAVIN